MDQTGRVETGAGHMCTFMLLTSTEYLLGNYILGQLALGPQGGQLCLVPSTDQTAAPSPARVTCRLDNECRRRHHELEKPCLEINQSFNLSSVDKAVASFRVPSCLLHAVSAK